MFKENGVKNGKIRDFPFKKNGIFSNASLKMEIYQN